MRQEEEGWAESRWELTMAQAKVLGAKDEQGSLEDRQFGVASHP